MCDGKLGIFVYQFIIKRRRQEEESCYLDIAHKMLPTKTALVAYKYPFIFSHML